MLLLLHGCSQENVYQLDAFVEVVDFMSTQTREHDLLDFILAVLDFEILEYDSGFPDRYLSFFEMEMQWA